MFGTICCLVGQLLRDIRGPEVNDELGGLMCVLILLDDREGVRVTFMSIMAIDSVVEPDNLPSSLCRPVLSRSGME